jgi:hypothetical protein
MKDYDDFGVLLIALKKILKDKVKEEILGVMLESE